MDPKTPPSKKHHHGDLKNALVSAGIALLEEGGIDALSLRKCAAKAGVSHAAPAHHFEGLKGLKIAIAEEGFHIFARHLRQAVDAAAPEPRARMWAICKGYVDFGVAHPGLLAVIFGAEGLAGLKAGGKAPVRTGPNKQFGAEAYLILREVCAPFVRDENDAWITEWQVWSLIHGFTLLYTSGEFGPSDVQISTGPFEAVISLLDTLQVTTAPPP